MSQNKFNRICILLLKILLTIIVLISIIFLILVRFTDLTISNKSKAIIGYNEESKEWIFNDWEKRQLTGYDGPYIFTKGKSIKEINVIRDSSQYVLERKVHDSIPNQFLCRIDNEDTDSFYFSLQKETIIDSASYIIPSKIIAISDIEGNYNAFYSFLLSNKIIDKQYNWIFNDGHLVLLGDFMDRGQNVTQILWLIYKLEQEALKFGGKVHYILGNHEIMNINSQIKYVNRKYLAIAQQYTNIKNYKEAYSELIKNNILINWLITKNISTIIGNYLFVHGGISPNLLDTGLSIDSINNIARKDKFIAEKNDLIFGRMGPLWYRGMIENYKDYYSKISENQVDRILKRYDVDKIIIGHTIVRDISYDFNQKILRIDVKHGKNKFSGKTIGILIENNMIYKINDLGEKFNIETVNY
jgi:hypothetical protein